MNLKFDKFKETFTKTFCDLKFSLSQATSSLINITTCQPNTGANLPTKGGVILKARQVCLSSASFKASALQA